MAVAEPDELVVLLAENGQPCGTALKAEVHSDSTPLHLAFSCWLFDGQQRTLLTRRAAGKRTWPNVWTNSYCGHPAPGERIEDAIHRRAAVELGTHVSEPVAVLPDFRYRAVMADGTVENEVCPVYIARLLSPAQPNPDEVDDLRWVPYADLPTAVSQAPSTYSPWMSQQLDLLLSSGWRPPSA